MPKTAIKPSNTKGLLLQDKTNKAQQQQEQSQDDQKPPPVTFAAPPKTPVAAPKHFLRTPSPNLMLVKQRAFEPTPGPTEQDLEVERMQKEAEEAEARDALFRDRPVEMPAGNTAQGALVGPSLPSESAQLIHAGVSPEMEWSDDDLGLDPPDLRGIDAKELLTASWTLSEGIEDSFIEGDAPIAEFQELDWSDLVCVPRPPSPSELHLTQVQIRRIETKGSASPEPQPARTAPRLQVNGSSRLHPASAAPREPFRTGSGGSSRPSSRLSPTPTPRASSALASSRPASAMRSRPPASVAPVKSKGSTPDLRERARAKQEDVQLSNRLAKIIGTQPDRASDQCGSFRFDL